MALLSYYRKIPVVIEAVQYDGKNAAEILAWSNAGEAFIAGDDLVIRTLEGDMKASPSDYIICGIAGEFYPCRADIFNESYELVEDVYDVLEAIEARHLAEEALYGES